MIELESLKSELSGIRKGITSFTILGYDGFRHENITPAHTFVTIDLILPDLGFLHIVSRDSYDEAFLERLINAFDRTKKKRYEKSLHVYGTYDLGEFDCVGIAPPSLAQAYESQSTILPKYGFQVFPMYGIEFLHGFSSDQFWSQRRRKDRWNVCILDWNRLIITKRKEPNQSAHTTPASAPR